MYNKILTLFSLSIIILISSCSNDDDTLKLNESELEVVAYFKEIALGFENGTSSEVTRKWNSPMRIYIDGTSSLFLNNKVEETINEINEIVTDGFFIEIVDSYELSNCHLFFGTTTEFIEEFPDAEDQIGLNFAIFDVWWDDNIINSARIFIDTDRPSLTQQESIIMEEITQTLGLGKDSARFSDSIFYETSSDGGFATEYADIDKELIRLLYHPDMNVGLNENQVDLVLKEILVNE